LWLEADRMGWFLPTMNAEKVDLQRDVVKNERRQSYENRPYGMAWETLSHALYPAGHPYSWSVIGSMADLSAASLEDTREFFRHYYAPNNAVIAVAGDVQAAEVKQEAMKYFGPIPRGPAIERPRAAAFSLAKDTMIVLEDKVQLPRLYYSWHTVKTLAGDDAPLDLLAYILTGARNSRLTDALVYDQELAADVNSYQDGKRLDGDFVVFATARPGHVLPELQAAMDEQLARIIAEGPTEREVEQARNDIESNFLNGLERVLRKADQLNRYYYFAGTADWFQEDLERYQSVTAADIQRVAREYLAKPKVVLSIVPEGRTDMAARSVEVTP
ncbi:MAG: M16 family metallopeptidase, partial [Gemmatimonadales bacterium]